MVLFLTAATIIGTVVAYLLVPMRSLGQDSWKIAAALMARHIGGGRLKLTSETSPVHAKRSPFSFRTSYHFQSSLFSKLKLVEYP